MDKKIVAFIDILGFKHFARVKYDFALELINNYLAILEAEILDQKMHPAPSYPSKELQDIAETNSLTAFEYLIPFSDSIVFVGENPALFVKQLSHFIYACYNYTSNHFTSAYDSEQNDDVKTDIPHKDKLHLHPTLFRGCISYGDVMVPRVGSIKNKVYTRTEIVVGPAIIDAIAIEGIGRGPRIFCTHSFVDILDQSDKKYWLLATDRIDVHEVLWPLAAIIPTSRFDIELSSFHEPLNSAINLWRGYRDHESEQQYYNYILLIAKACLSYGTSKGRRDESKSFIKQVIETSDFASHLQKIFDSPTIPLK